jgi:hypothetical protein
MVVASHVSMDWFVGENLNRFYHGFYHQIYRGFRFQFSHHPILWMSKNPLISQWNRIDAPSYTWPWLQSFHERLRDVLRLGCCTGKAMVHMLVMCLRFQEVYIYMCMYIRIYVILQIMYIYKIVSDYIRYGIILLYYAYTWPVKLKISNMSHKHLDLSNMFFLQKKSEAASAKNQDRTWLNVWWTGKLVCRIITY